MRNNFQFIALQDNEFNDLFLMDEEELINIGAVKMIADKKPGFPCRVSLKDAEIGEEVILLNYQYHFVNSPYKANGPIFIRKEATTAMLDVNEIPDIIYHRLLSLRGYNIDAMLVDARVTEGVNVRKMIDDVFDNEEVAYIHIHYAKPGCYSCLVKRM
ncbi:MULTISPECIES: DUF1203 domain-containing protein [Niallia]|jgi:Protein of unknown function (DUF1203)|uniref:DUF1203 domain-containing protein n=1 Tax=Niallia TaxID=2837506 RepID=UPI000F45CC5B|nr:DUF1203 domain-containing protein [Niallia circulans]AYV66155.1 DUF1203 domain-containing protein [Niallia circulans]AYV71030.1 DUF1203 domain-containing protein [Niallia circulans]NRG27899.1 DUF1203 domain-containing protein [Niallia circulans]